jgi:hypothetical protein
VLESSCCLTEGYSTSASRTSMPRPRDREQAAFREAFQTAKALPVYLQQPTYLQTAGTAGQCQLRAHALQQRMSDAVANRDQHWGAKLDSLPDAPLCDERPDRRFDPLTIRLIERRIGLHVTMQRLGILEIYISDAPPQMPSTR